MFVVYFFDFLKTNPLSLFFNSVCVFFVCICVHFKSGDDDEDGDDEENDESYDGVPIDLKRLIDDLSPSLRQKVLSGQKIRVDGASSDDSDSDSESKSKVSKLSNSDAAAALTGNWGKKRNYWSGDTADLEIGQDMQDALDEEQAANEIQANRLRGMDVNDYGSSDGDSEYESDQQFSSKNNKVSTR